MDATLVLPKIDHAFCTGCAECVDVCHVNALAIQASKAVIVNPGDCDYCTDCEAVCPVCAIACPFEVVFRDAWTGVGIKPHRPDEPQLPVTKEE